MIIRHALLDSDGSGLLSGYNVMILTIHLRVFIVVTGIFYNFLSQGLHELIDYLIDMNLFLKLPFGIRSRFKTMRKFNRYVDNLG